MLTKREYELIANFKAPKRKTRTTSSKYKKLMLSSTKVRNILKSELKKHFTKDKKN